MNTQHYTYLSTILFHAIIAMRNNDSDEKANELTDNLMTSSDYQRLFEDMEDAVNQSTVDYDLIMKQLIHFLKTDEYWMSWANKCMNRR